MNIIPLLEIAGSRGERWGFTIIEGGVVAVYKSLPTEEEPDPVWLPFGLRPIPVKLLEYVDVFVGQHFALLSRAGFILPKPKPTPPVAPTPAISGLPEGTKVTQGEDGEIEIQIPPVAPKKLHGAAALSVARAAAKKSASPPAKKAKRA